MPSLGADMEAGTLVEWTVKPGDHVKRGDIVAVVETQKGAIEIEIFETGRVEQMLVEVGAKVPVGTPLARIRADQELPAPGLAAAPRPAEVATPITALVAAPSVPLMLAPRPRMVLEGSSGDRVRASPAARQLASFRGIDLTAVSGSGPLGAILRVDVSAAPRPLPHPPRRSAPSVSISTQCAPRSPRRWRGRNAKSHTTTLSIRSM